MKYNKILQVLLPRHDKFFNLFEEAAKNLQEVGAILREAVRLRSNHEREDKINQIEALEHQGDDITHRIFHELSSSFITPFDREDIHVLAASLDDVLDYIQGTTKRITLYGIDKFPSEGIVLADLLKQAIDEIATAIPMLRDMANKEKVLSACVRINSLENSADDIFEHAVAGLFKKSIAALEVIKIKEVLVGLETATDKCEDAANALETIILKNT